MEYKFPELPFAYDALEPHIDRMTMEIHHSKHHKAYFDKFIAAIAETDYAGKPLKEIFANVSKFPAAVRNNAGGFYNHKLFWDILSPHGGGEPTHEIGEAITKQFGSFDAFKTKFSEAAINRFGSGWVWLSVKDNGELCICSSTNQDNPLMDVHDCSGRPVLCLDVWEHAYYLKYQNRRPDYIQAFWNVVNWDKVNEFYERKIK